MNSVLHANVRREFGFKVNHLAINLNQSSHNLIHLQNQRFNISHCHTSKGGEQNKKEKKPEDAHNVPFHTFGTLESSLRVHSCQTSVVSHKR